MSILPPLASIAPVWFERADGGSEQRLWLLPLVLGIALLLLAGAMTWRLLRARVREDPAERAFRTLARRCGVRSRDRAVARALGEACGCAPVALLVSRGALRRAAQRAGAAAGGPPPAGVDRLEQRLFAHAEG